MSTYMELPMSDTSRAAAEMWRAEIRSALDVSDDVTLPECRLMIGGLRAAAFLDSPTVRHLPMFPGIWRVDLDRIGRRVQMQTLIEAASREGDESDAAALLARLAVRYEAPLSTVLHAMAGAWRAYETAIGEPTAATPQAIEACWRLRVEALTAAQRL